MKLAFKNYLFDLDGTLVDTAPDIIDCFNQGCEAAGISGVRIDSSAIGPPLAEMVKRGIPGISEEKTNQLVAGFRSCYDNNNFSKTNIYPGVKELLDTLASCGCNLYVATNKLAFASNKILKKVGLREYFTDVITPDAITGQRMDKYQMIKYLIEARDLEKAETVMIGDGTSDIVSARKNEISSIAILSGYGLEPELKSTFPDMIFQKISDIKSKLT